MSDITHVRAYHFYYRVRLREKKWRIFDEKLQDRVLRCQKLREKEIVYRKRMDTVTGLSFMFLLFFSSHFLFGSIK